MYNYTAFEHFDKLVSGSLEHVVLAVKKRYKDHRQSQILIFSDSTGKQMDFDLSGTDKETLDRLKIYSAIESNTTTTAGVGRPKLGVVAREISLLPIHWEWLNNQPGGASSSIRRLIDEKIKSVSSDKNKIKNAQEITYKFLSAIAGDLPNFEEAIRFLYRKDKDKFAQNISSWPKDIRDHALMLSSEVFDS